MKIRCVFMLALFCVTALLLCAGETEGRAAGVADVFYDGEEAEPVSLTAQQQYEANIFLSNFSEQGFCEYGAESFDAAEASDAQLFAFAHLWAKINRRAAIGYSGSYETMSLDAVNSIVNRYIWREGLLQPAEGTNYSAELGMGHYDWDRCWYSGGYFYYPAADGESFNRFTVVEEAERYPDGRCLLRFTVYELDLQRYWDNNGIPSEYYWLTPFGAAQRAAWGEITPMRMGEALCMPRVQQDGRQTYALVRYTIYPLDVD